jgi:outer membrane protein
MLNLMLNKRRPLLTKHAKGRIKARPLPASPARGGGDCLARCASGVTRHQMALFHANIDYRETAMFKRIAMTGFALLTLCGPVQAETKIGFINNQRVLAESPQAAKAKKRIEKDFEKRDQDLQRMVKQVQTLQSALDKGASPLSETDRRNKEKELSDLTRDLQRKQREFREDLSQRQNDEMALIFEKINKTIKQIADAEKYEIIFEDAVYFNKRIDITDKVIKALGDGSK